MNTCKNMILKLGCILYALFFRLHGLVLWHDPPPTGRHRRGAYFPVAPRAKPMRSWKQYLTGDVRSKLSCWTKNKV